MAELEKLGPKFRVALRIAKDPRFQRLPCMHKGTYADDCLVNRVTEVSNVFWVMDVAILILGLYSTSVILWLRVIAI